MGRIRNRHSAAIKAKVALIAAQQDRTIAELAKPHLNNPVQNSHWKNWFLDGLEGLFKNRSAGHLSGVFDSFWTHKPFFVGRRRFAVEGLSVIPDLSLTGAHQSALNSTPVTRPSLKFTMPQSEL